MELEQMVQQLQTYQRRLHAYTHVTSLLSYDAATAMPSGASSSMGDTMEIMAGEVYRLNVDEGIGQLLDALQSRRTELDFQTRREVEELCRQRDKQTRVPEAEVMAAEKAVNDGNHYWQLAKAAGDYALFKPYLADLLAIREWYAGFIRPGAPVYDVLLDEFEPGCTQALLDPFFELVRQKLVPLLRAVLHSTRKPDVSFLQQTFPIGKQKQLSDYLMDVMGIDKTRCVLRESEHPFTMDFSRNDVRITTKYVENDLLSNMFSVIHESGHAMYELHVGEELLHSCMGHGATSAIHESQSRLWENFIARSRPFCQLIFPKVQELFPRQMDGVTQEMFYRAVNAAQPSLIRTDADELTYSFHVLVRYELEKKLFAHELTVEQLPGEWNRLYQSYLGIDVPDDARGVLQDAHWAGGAFGYFPSYALGTAYAAQFMAALRRAVDVDGCLARGEVQPIRDWLVEHIYRHGMLLTPDELLRSATGESFDPRYYIDYLTDKYTTLYEATV